MTIGAVLERGRVLSGRVRLVDKLGAGGFSSVWRGVELDTGREVAVKILHPELERIPAAVERFILEAELLSRFDHPSIARAYQTQSSTEPRFFTLEYVRGENLRIRLGARSEKARAIPFAGAAWMCSQLADALDHAHRQSVIHRDLKPANIMVNTPHEPAFVKVLDFGAAKSLDSQIDPTTVGRIIGSILYMAPEQLLGKTIDERTDQFALAVTLYEVLTLRRPWALDRDGSQLPLHRAAGETNSQLDVMKRIINGERPSARAVREDLPPAVDDVLHRALEPERERRYESIVEFRDAFRLALLDSPEMSAGTISSVDGTFETMVTVEHDVRALREKIRAAPTDPAGPNADPEATEESSWLSAFEESDGITSPV